MKLDRIAACFLGHINEFLGQRDVAVVIYADLGDEGYLEDLGSVEVEGIQKPYEIDRRHPLVSSYLAALGALGKPRRVHGSEGATVITFFQDRGIPAIATGFGCSGCAHMVDEYVTIDNIYNGGLILENFLRTMRFARS